MSQISPEEKIIQAAEIEFIERGFDGARMQAIADKAGINKSLLHYYFRSKQKLFEVIFKTAFNLFIPKILKIFDDDSLDFFEKIRRFVAAYIDIISKYPQIPGFILHEIGTNQSALLKVLSEVKPNTEIIKKQIEDEIAKGTIIEIKPEQLIINILSMCIFPIIVSPVASLILMNDDKSGYAKLIEERKIHVAEFIIRAIQKTDNKPQS